MGTVGFKKVNSRGAYVCDCACVCAFVCVCVCVLGVVVFCGVLFVMRGVLGWMDGWMVLYVRVGRFYWYGSHWLRRR